MINKAYEIRPSTDVSCCKEMRSALPDNNTKRWEEKSSRLSSILLENERGEQEQQNNLNYFKGVFNRVL